MTYRIKIDITSTDRADTIGRFEKLCEKLRDTEYAFGSGSGGGGGGGGGGPSISLSWEVSGPPEKPLSNTELRRLREMLK